MKYPAGVQFSSVISCYFLICCLFLDCFLLFHFIITQTNWFQRQTTKQNYSDLASVPILSTLFSPFSVVSFQLHTHTLSLSNSSLSLTHTHTHTHTHLSASVGDWSRAADGKIRGCRRPLVHTLYLWVLHPWIQPTMSDPLRANGIQIQGHLYFHS